MYQCGVGVEFRMMCLVEVGVEAGFDGSGWNEAEFGLSCALVSASEFRWGHLFVNCVHVGSEFLELFCACI